MDATDKPLIDRVKKILAEYPLDARALPRLC